MPHGHARAGILNVPKESCKSTDEFICFKADGRKNYATANTLDAHVNKFCEQDVKPPPGPDVYGWEVRRRYKQGTPDG